MSVAIAEQVDVRDPRLYFPQEGFGAIYRRRVLNEFLVDLVAKIGASAIAEVPLDEYGVPGAGSLILGKLGCRTTLVSAHGALLERAARTWRERIGREPNLLEATPHETGCGDGQFDLSWSFDRLQAQPEKERLLAEQARIARTVLVIVPNAWNYAQPWHWVYHQVCRTRCDFVGPRRWLGLGPIIRVLTANGMEVMRSGLIDVPWWPGFPELPAMVRRMVKPWVRPTKPDMDDLGLDEPTLSALLERAERATFIERSRAPLWMRAPFAHNLYVLAGRA